MSFSRKRKRQEAATDDAGEVKKLGVACTICRKQKIRCDLVNGEPPCTRCQRRGLSCVLHTPLRNPAADHRQLGLLGRDIRNIHATLAQICAQTKAEPPLPLLSVLREQEHDITIVTGLEDEGHDDACELSPPGSPSDIQAPMDTYLTATSHTTKEGAIRSRLRRRTSERADIISKGLISLEIADNLVHRYLTHLDRFLYGIASHFRDVHHVRETSTILLAAMCAVTAMQQPDGEELFKVCSREFRSLVSACLFEKQDIEHIRALCIGSFWLPDASRILLSDAIRRAADARLHHHFHKLTADSNRTHPMATSERTHTSNCLRLWYLLFVCDQHLSILHNRDPLLRVEKDAVERRELFLLGDSLPTSQDIRTISQVALLRIMASIRHALGCEHATTLAGDSSSQIGQFVTELDQWFARFSPMFEPDPHIGDFPLAGLTMHYQFAKLFLGHHVFRGLAEGLLPTRFLPAAKAAHRAAITIFAMIVENDAFQRNLVGMPHYFHVMISFAGHFLIDICIKFQEQLDMLVEQDLDRIKAALEVFARTSAMPQHPLSRITTGIEKKLNDFVTHHRSTSVLTEAASEGPVHPTPDAQNGTLDDQVLPAFGFDLDYGFPNNFLFGDFGEFGLPDTSNQW